MIGLIYPNFPTSRFGHHFSHPRLLSHTGWLIGAHLVASMTGSPESNPTVPRFPLSVQTYLSSPKIDPSLPFLCSCVRMAQRTALFPSICQVHPVFCGGQRLYCQPPNFPRSLKLASPTVEGGFLSSFCIPDFSDAGIERISQEW